MKRQHEIFSLEFVKTGDEIGSYKKAYPKTATDEAARVSAARLLKKPEIQNEIATLKRQIVTNATAAATEEIKSEIKLHALNLGIKRDILYKIAKGKIKIPYFDSKGVKRFKYPDPEDMIKAIQLDNELTGEGFRPPEPGGTTINGPVYNTVVRKTVFKTKETTGRKQTFEITPND